MLNTLVLGLVNDKDDVTVKVSFHESFCPTVSWQGFVAVTSFDVEVSGLQQMLSDLQSANWCPGSDPRSKKCPVYCTSPGMCKFCTLELDKKIEQLKRPLHLNTPLVSAPVSSLIREVKATRTKLKSTEGELRSVQRKLQNGTVEVSEDIESGLQQVMDNSQIDDPFIQMFYDEQKKASKRDPRGRRWHPMMIRFAIFLHYQSPRAYEALRNTGVLLLPNKSTLRDYTNFFKPAEGFQPHVMKQLGDLARDLPESKRFAALMHDEMAVRGDLVYDHRGGELVGFINPETWNIRQDVMALATHVIVFMVVGINSNIKMSLGYFATKCATSDVLFPLLWEVIALLEQQGLKIISCTSDKASPNQRLYRLHGNGGIVHQTMNIYAAEERPLFFLSDPPHLIKTIRNNIFNSKAGGTRCLWNRDQHIWWSHIARIYEDDTARQLRLSKLRDEHIRLTPASKMSVRLAAQVLSQTVGAILRDYYGPEVQETSHFVLACDRLFDCLNTRSFVEHIQKRKPDLAPYRTINDPRFQYLQSFLDYLDNWKTQVQNRDGFTKSEKEKMFISNQTYEGIATTVRRFTGLARYLLGHDVQYVFSNVFCQDPLEEHFGRHRGLGHRSRNPSIYEFGYQENQLRMQRDLASRFTTA